MTLEGHEMSGAEFDAMTAYSRSTPEPEEDCADCPHYYAAHNLWGPGTACMGYDENALETDTFCSCKKFRRTQVPRRDAE